MINNKILRVLFISLFIVLGNRVASGSANAVRSGLFESQTVEASCTDSDGGLNYELAGTVTGIGPNGYPYSKADVCETSITLKEFYCSGTGYSAKNYSCPKRLPGGRLYNDHTNLYGCGWRYLRR
jgi:hypothetical protein